MDLLNQLQRNDAIELGGCCNLPDEWDYMSYTAQHRYLTDLVKQTKDDYEKAKEMRHQFLHGGGIVGGELLGNSDEYEYGSALVGGKRNKKAKKRRQALKPGANRLGKVSGLPYCPKGERRGRIMTYGNCEPYTSKKRAVGPEKERKPRQRRPRGPNMNGINKDNAYDSRGRPNYAKFKKLLLEMNPDLTKQQIDEAFAAWRLSGGDFWSSFKKGFMMPFEAAAKLAPLAPLIL